MKNMKQINIGTCVPGQFAERWLPVMKDKGYECFAINFHMGYYGVDLKALAPKVNERLADTDTYVSTIGYYCNALENESQLHDLEFAIDNAHFSAQTPSPPSRARWRARRLRRRYRDSKRYTPNWRAAPRPTALSWLSRTARWAVPGTTTPAISASTPTRGK